MSGLPSNVANRPYRCRPVTASRWTDFKRSAAPSSSSLSRRLQRWWPSSRHHRPSGHASTAAAVAHSHSAAVAVALARDLAAFASLGAVSMAQAIEEGTYEAKFEGSIANELAAINLLSDDDVEEEEEEEQVDAAAAAAAARKQQARSEDIFNRSTCGLYACGSNGASVCRFDGACFQRDVQHWLKFAHPCEVRKPYCPALARGEACFNKGPEFAAHNKAFSHGPLPSAMEAAARSNLLSGAAGSGSSARPNGGANSNAGPSFSAPHAAAGPPARPIAPRLPSRADGVLRSKFVAPPFSRLDAQQGPWQARKREWHALFDSGAGRDSTLLSKGRTTGLGVMQMADGTALGTSIFDPVLAEPMCNWFAPRPRKIRTRVPSSSSIHSLAAASAA